MEESEQTAAVCVIDMPDTPDLSIHSEKEMEELRKENRDQKETITELRRTNVALMEKNECLRGENTKVTELMEKNRELIEKNTELMENNTELNKHVKLKREESSKHSLIDMYSEVLDEIAYFDKDSAAGMHDLPRVVIVGDKSSGKSSVLEAIIQTRIFPREMLIRSPIRVTLSEGLHHIAKFKNHTREYDLTQTTEMEDMWEEMRKKTVNDEIISIEVRGPGLKRILLIELPGIIGTVTKEMTGDAREQIRYICKIHMKNPNAIILCVQDGSLDAERSNVTDLVSSVDPSGKRTILVLTKVDLASEHNLHRIEDIVTGRVFNMKAAGHFAVVTGKAKGDNIQDIKIHEREFFLKFSTFVKHEIPHQLNSDNLRLAVSKSLLKMFKESMNREAAFLKSTQLSLVKEWQINFPKNRVMDRGELFEKARGEILDEVVNLTQISSKHWESTFQKNLWEKISKEIFEEIYLPEAFYTSPWVFVETVDFKLKQWCEKKLSRLAIEVGKSTMQVEIKRLLRCIPDPLFKKITTVINEMVYEWVEKTEDDLRLAQLHMFDDGRAMNMNEWDSAVKFMHTAVQQKMEEAEQAFNKRLGPGTMQTWIKWITRRQDESDRRQTVGVLERIMIGKESLLILTEHELNEVKTKVMVKDAFIRDTWRDLQRLWTLRRVFSNKCGKGKINYSEDRVKCVDILFFSRIEKMLNVTSRVLTRCVTINEARRFEEAVTRLLDDIRPDRSKLKELLSGKRVTIAEDLKKVGKLQLRLEGFIGALTSAVLPFQKLP